MTMTGSTTSAVTGTGSPELSKGEQTRRSVLEAAIARFGRDGYRLTSVADISRDAGVSGTVAYVYFANKEDLFRSALDEDAAAAINEGLPAVLDQRRQGDWRENLVVALAAAVDGHPLARRVLAGLEPEVAARFVELPALEDLRRAVAERLADEQRAGTVRPEIDPQVVGSGLVSIILALLMSVVQLGADAVATHVPDVIAVFEAALDPC